MSLIVSLVSFSISIQYKVTSIIFFQISLHNEIKRIGLFIKLTLVARQNLFHLTFAYIGSFCLLLKVKKNKNLGGRNFQFLKILKGKFLEPDIRCYAMF